MAKDTLKRHNRFNTEWCYAKSCWDALVNDLPIPPVPFYQMYEVDEATGKEKLIKQLKITPMKVTYKGKTVFGD